MSSTANWVPAACTLPTTEQPVRSAEFDRLFKAVVAIDRGSPTAVRLTVTDTEWTADAVADLAARESQCCSFFSFAVTAASGTVTMDVAVSAGHVAVLDALQA